VQHRPDRGGMLDKEPELFEDQRWYQVSIIKTEDNRLVLTGGKEYVERGSGKIKLECLIESLPQFPKSQTSIPYLHSPVLALPG
jgi:hypothetical protein